MLLTWGEHPTARFRPGAGVHVHSDVSNVGIPATHPLSGGMYTIH